MEQPAHYPDPPGRVGMALGTGLFLITFLLAWWGNAHRLDEVLVHKSDQWGYYQYLPALIGTHEWLELPYATQLEHGRTLSIFSSGVAWLQAPFFGAAWLVASLTGAAVDGYSMPFVLAQFVAAAFYLALGCVLLMHALRRSVPLVSAIMAALLIAGATNLHFYAVYDTGMSHVYAFFLIAALVYFTVRMDEAPRGSWLIGLLACAGLLVLVRQLNAIALLFPLLYGTSAGLAIRQRIGWVRQFPMATLLGALLAVVPWVPQVMYWKHVTGQWFVFTYGKKGEGFDWLHPHLLDVLASHQNGWFVYTPLMFVVLGLLLWHAWKGTPNARLILTIWTLVWYTYASWWCWWLGGSFGHRGFIEYYALLALPLAWGLQALFQRPRWMQEVAWMGLALLVFLNLRMSRIYQWPWEGPDWTWAKLAENYLRALLG